MLQTVSVDMSSGTVCTVTVFSGLTASSTGTRCCLVVAIIDAQHQSPMHVLLGNLSLRCCASRVLEGCPADLKLKLRKDL